MMPTLRKSMAAAALVVALVLSVSGCATTPTSSTAAASTSVADPAFSAKIDAHIDSLKQPQTTPPPSGGPKAVAGKNIVIVTITLAEASAKRAVTSLEDAIKAIGWTSTTYDGQNSPTAANQKLEQAVTTNPDAIILVALDTTMVGSGLAAAKAAGIPIACEACWDPTASDTRGEYVSAEPALSRLSDMGAASAEYAYQYTKGHPRFLAMNDVSLSNLAARQVGFDAFLQECKNAGGDCTLVASKPFQVADLNTTFSSQAVSLAQANPDFNAFWVSFDFAGLQAINGLRQAGLTDNGSFMVSSNGDGANIDLIAQNGYQKATVAISWEWSAWANVDNLNRVFAGQPIAEQNVPIRLFDASNADQAENGNWDGDVDFRAAYEAAWKG